MPSRAALGLEIVETKRLGVDLPVEVEQGVAHAQLIQREIGFVLAVGRGHNRQPQSGNSQRQFHCVRHSLPRLQVKTRH